MIKSNKAEAVDWEEGTEWMADVLGVETKFSLECNRKPRGEKRLHQSKLVATREWNQ